MLIMKRNCFFPLMALLWLAAACQSVQQFSIDYMLPAEVSFPASLRRVGVVNNMSGSSGSVPPEAEAELQELVELGRETKVQFVWAAHPGGSIDLGSEEDLQALLDKFDQLYSIGVRQFGLFFDDSSTDFTNQRLFT